MFHVQIRIGFFGFRIRIQLVIFFKLPRLKFILNVCLRKIETAVSIILYFRNFD